MSFCTAINCMDGRVQLPVILFLKKRFEVEFVDSITAAGPIKTIAEGRNQKVIESILRRIKISMNKHKSKGMAVVGHEDCAGNPVDKQQQMAHLKASLAFLGERYPGTEILALWVDGSWTVHEIPPDEL